MLVLSSFIGSKKWKNYTLDVDFHIDSGAEGCIIYIAFQDDTNYVMYNVGGWGNSVNAFEPTRKNEKNTQEKANASYDSEYWHHITIIVNGSSADAYVDGVLMNTLV